MSTAAPVNQLSAGGIYPHEDCGEACVASILIDAGKADSVRNIEAFDWRHGDSPADGTGGTVHIERLKASDIPSHVSTGDTRANVLEGIAKGYSRWMVAIWSDHNGDPHPGSGIGHWILVYGYDARFDLFYVMNPIGGRLVTYPGASITAAQQRYGISIDVALGTPKPVNNGELRQSVTLNKPVVEIRYVPGGGPADAWIFTGDGGVFTRGAAPFFGSAANDKPGDVVAAAVTPSGRGYWLVNSAGAVYSFGDAGYHGGASDVKLNAPIVGIAATPSGAGYALAGADGGVFNYGDAAVKGLLG